MARRSWVAIACATLGLLVAVPAAQADGAAARGHPTAAAPATRTRGSVDTDHHAALITSTSRLHPHQVRSAGPLVASFAAATVAAIVAWWLARARPRRDFRQIQFLAFLRRGPPAYLSAP